MLQLPLQVLYFSVLLISLFVIHFISKPEPIDSIIFDTEKLYIHEKFFIITIVICTIHFLKILT